MILGKNIEMCIRDRVLSVQSGHELYPKGQSCERYPLEDCDRIW